MRRQVPEALLHTRRPSRFKIVMWRAYPSPVKHLFRYLQKSLAHEVHHLCNVLAEFIIVFYEAFLTLFIDWPREASASLCWE